MKTFSSVKVGKTSLGAMISREKNSDTYRTKQIAIVDEDIYEIVGECVDIHHIDFKDCRFSTDFFYYVHFSHCTFKNCIFNGVVMYGSTFRYCEFFNTDFRDCTMNFCTFECGSFDNYCVISYTVLRDCSFHLTNFNEANLKCRNMFDNTDLTDAINPPYVKMACPTHGSFVGWKKIYDGVEGYCLIKLEIPAKAKRSSATSRKCRAEYAKVLGVYNMQLERIDCRKVVNMNYAKCVYKVGEIVYPDSFDEKRYEECSHGIHFFIDVNDAIEY